MFAKIHQTKKDKIVAICDEHIIGKRIGYFFINPHFYKEQRVNEQKAIELLKQATIIKAGLISPEAVIKVKNIPHAQMVVIFE